MNKFVPKRFPDCALPEKQQDYYRLLPIITITIIIIVIIIIILISVARIGPVVSILDSSRLFITVAVIRLIIIIVGREWVCVLVPAAFAIYQLF